MPRRDEDLRFGMSHIPRIDPHPGPRVLALAAPGHRVDTAATLGRYGPLGTLVQWVPVSAPACALRVAPQHGLHAVTVVDADTRGHITGLALLVSACLRKRSGPRQAAGRPGVTCTHRPEATPNRVGVPHVVTVAAPEGPRDLVVWELMPSELLASWTGIAPARALAAVEAVLPELLVARRLARAGLLDRVGPAGVRADAFLRGRAPATTHVLRNPALFRRLATEIGDRTFEEIATTPVDDTWPEPSAATQPVR